MSDAAIWAHKYLVVAHVSHSYIRLELYMFLYCHMLVSSLLLDFQTLNRIDNQIIIDFIEETHFYALV